MQAHLAGIWRLSLSLSSPTVLVGGVAGQAGGVGDGVLRPYLAGRQRPALSMSSPLAQDTSGEADEAGAGQAAGAGEEAEGGLAALHRLSPSQLSVSCWWIVRMRRGGLSRKSRLHLSAVLLERHPSSQPRQTPAQGQPQQGWQAARARLDPHVWGSLQKPMHQEASCCSRPRLGRTGREAWRQCCCLASPPLVGRAARRLPQLVTWHTALAALLECRPLLLTLSHLPAQGGPRQVAWARLLGQLLLLSLRQPSAWGRPRQMAPLRQGGARLPRAERQAHQER